MRSQTKWGMFFMVLALAILIISALHPIAMIYSVPLFILGVALIIFRKREEIIEEP